MKILALLTLMISCGKTAQLPISEGLTAKCTIGPILSQCSIFNDSGKSVKCSLRAEATFASRYKYRAFQTNFLYQNQSAWIYIQALNPLDPIVHIEGKADCNYSLY